MLRLICVLSIMISSTYGFSGRFSARFSRSTTTRMLFGNPQDNKPAPKKDQGLFGGMGNMMEQMKKAQEIAKQAEAINKELADTIVTGADPSGLVVSTFNGLAMPISIKIADGAMSMSAEALSIAATQAVNDGFSKSQGQMISKMQAVYAGMAPPS